jgi:hypothetical protein
VKNIDLGLAAYNDPNSTDVTPLARYR